MPTAFSLGTKTRWGKIAAVGTTSGERYYWVVDKHGDVAMMPAIMVEPEDISTAIPALMSPGLQDYQDDEGRWRVAP